MLKDAFVNFNMYHGAVSVSVNCAQCGVYVPVFTIAGGLGGTENEKSLDQ
jgi:hypothetical protein